jgi:hypothetical protein
MAHIKTNLFSKANLIKSSIKVFKIELNLTEGRLGDTQHEPCQNIKNIVSQIESKVSQLFIAINELSTDLVESLTKENIQLKELLAVLQNSSNQN